MVFNFSTYNDFLNEYKTYHFHECDKCRSIRELNNEHIDIIIENRIMHFIDLLVLKCINCQNVSLPMHSKQMIDGCYKIMKREGHLEGTQTYRGYKKQFDYCVEQNFEYDYRDYFNIPGLSHDEEHSVEGFLTPVYFTNKVLLYFLSDPDYNVNLFSETYGYFQFKDEWGIPFGINSNNKVVFWLGDLSYLDEHTLAIMKPHNIKSDHQLINSEFYIAQMCCFWSEPNKEVKICHLKNDLFKSVQSKYNISLFHLVDEVKHHIDSYQKPVIITEKTIEPTINMLHKVLVEGVNIAAFKELYLRLNSTPDPGYNNWKSIKLYEALLQLILPKDENIRSIISPLYLLNDFRQYYDHLLSTDKKNTIKQNIIRTLEVQDFSCIDMIYSKLLTKLSILFEYLIIGYST